MARSSSSSVWRAVLGRLHAQQNVLSSNSSSSYGALLHGFRFMSTGASSKLFVGGLSWSTDENVLKQAFSSYGDISEAKVVVDRETGRSRGFGFVSFMSIEDAESAKESMDGNDINGRTVRVDFAIEKPPSAQSFGGFGGGGSFGRGGMISGGESADSSYGDSFSRSNTSFPSKDSFESMDSFGRDSFGSKDSSENKSSDEDSFDNDSVDDRTGSKGRY